MLGAACHPRPSVENRAGALAFSEAGEKEGGEIARDAPYACRAGGGFSRRPPRAGLSRKVLKPAYPGYNPWAGEGLRPFEPRQRPPRGCCDPLGGCLRRPWLRPSPRPSRCEARPTASSTPGDILPSPSDHPRRGYSPAFNSVDKWWGVPGITLGLARDSAPSIPRQRLPRGCCDPLGRCPHRPGCEHLFGGERLRPRPSKGECQQPG